MTRLILLTLLACLVMVAIPLAWAQAPAPASEVVSPGDTMLTLDTIKTFAGQTLAIMVMTQAVRYMAPNLAGNGVMGVAFLVGVILQIVFVAYGEKPAAYVLAVLNGFLVATAAMKTAEIVKGTAPAAAAPK